MHYTADWDTPITDGCVVAVVDLRGIHPSSFAPSCYKEFYIDCVYETAVERHLERGKPVGLHHSSGVKQSYPVEQIAFFRTLTDVEIEKAA